MRTTLCYFFTIALCCCSETLFSQLNWQGDTSSFRIENNEIFSQFDISADIAEIYTVYPVSGDCTWEFTVQYDFNPSSANHSIMYLASNKEQFSSMNGYYLSVGASNDALEFYVRTSGKDSMIIQGKEKRLDTSPLTLKIQLTRTKDGFWEMYSKLPDEPTSIKEGYVNHNAFSSFNRFGWLCKYTKTRAEKFSLRDIHISGNTIKDTIPPKLVAINVLNANTIKLSFDENIRANSEHFNIAPHSIKIDSTILKGQNVVLHLESFLVEGIRYSLIMSGIQDLQGNTLNKQDTEFSYQPFSLVDAFLYSNTSVFIALNKDIETQQLLQHITFNKKSPVSFIQINQENKKFILEFSDSVPANHFLPCQISALPNTINEETLDTIIDLVYHPIGAGDVVINEIMHDPVPSVKLPEAEYIELFNNSDYALPIAQIKLHINNTTLDLNEFKTLPAQSYLLIINKKDTVYFEDQKNVTFTNSSFQLANQGFDIWISNNAGQVIDFFNFEPNDYYSAFKAAGGWSLERIDYENLSDQYNWEVCKNNLGGTPVLENSVLGISKDNEAPELHHVEHRNDSTIALIFNEEMLNEQIEILENYSINDNHIALATADYPTRHQAELRFISEFERNKTYQLKVNNLSDLCGNLLWPFHYTFQLPEEVSPTNILFNELMANPLEGCIEYIELFNNSPYYYDLSNLIIGEVDADDEIDKRIPVCEYRALFPPKTYLILTKDRNRMFACYDITSSTHILEVPTLPTLNNESETLALLTVTGLEIDKVSYTSEWHSPLIKNNKGVALERISANTPTNDANSWTSAASSVGFATPGTVNSQQLTEQTAHKKLALEYENISPNNDGYQDMIILNFPATFAGYSVSIQIFDATGRLIKEAYNNYFLGTQSTLAITNLNHEHIPSGIYGLRVKGVHPSGQTVEEMLPFVISFK